MARILVIDDERSIRNTLKEILEYEDHEVCLAADGAEGLARVADGRFDLVLCDIMMPGMDGVEVLEKIMEQQPDTAVVMISGHGTVENAVESIKKGAFDFIQKPLDLNRLLITVKNAMDRQHLVSQTKVLRRKISKTLDMIGESAAMQRVRVMIDRVAPTDARVLITGRNGTGKELVARWLHEKSQRAAGPFVEVNCAAIPSELIESELFGHEKGSFTSAYKDRRGKFETADGGTLFLDEIGDMSLSAQAKVLRALQENKISRVGSDKEIKVDVRILAATNKNLQEEIARGNFREDLYHRLSVILIDVPSLNERLDDIPLLVNHFNKIICGEYGTAPKNFSAGAIAAMQQINWTGNIRQLHNVVERLIILCGPDITADDVARYAHPVAS